MAGVPFATAGSTNVIHVVKLTGDELEQPPRASGSSAGISPGISRARKPSGPTFLASARPASPCSHTPHSKAVSGSAPRASRPPTIPASTSPLPETPRPGPPPRYLHAVPSGATMWLCDALDQHDGVVTLGAARGRSRADRPRPRRGRNRAGSPSRRHGAAGSGGHPRRARVAARPGASA